MKTIAVLTDFSVRAEDAARYALGLAGHLNANILLYNTFITPSAEPLELPAAWSLEDKELQMESERELQKLAEKLRNELIQQSTAGSKPMIDCKCDYGTLSDNLKALLTDGEILMLVIGSHNKGMSGLMMGNHVREVIDNTSIPVLVVPENHSFKSLDKITFVTDLKAFDFEVINFLSGLARPFDAEITLAHLSVTKTKDESSGKMTERFLQEISSVTNYRKIYYKKVEQKKTEEGLSWISENVAFDMLVMVHQNESFWDLIFNKDKTHKIAIMANERDLPLLVYPHPAKTLPDF